MPCRPSSALLFSIFSLLASATVAFGAADDAVDVVEETRSTSLHGTWRSDDGTAHPASLTVVQRTASAHVELVLDGHECFPRSTFDARITLEGFEARSVVGGMSLVLTGDPGLEEILGNFEALREGPCPDKRGTLAFMR